MMAAPDPSPCGQGSARCLSQQRHLRRSPCRPRGLRLNRQSRPRAGLMQGRTIMVMCKSIGDVARASEPKTRGLLAKAFGRIVGDRELYRGGAR